MGNRLFWNTVPISLLLHMAMFLFVGILAQHQSVPLKMKLPILVEIQKDKDSDARRRKVVQSNRGQITERAADDAFLGEKTRIVDRQSVAKQRNAVLTPDESPAGERVSIIRPLGKFGVPIPHGVAGPVPGLVARPEWARFSDEPLDYVKGVKEGDFTALNTKEFVYYGYFQRIRGRLDRAWQEKLKERLIKLYRSGRRLASDKDHVTKTIVYLDAKGEVIKVQVIEESGVRDLDEAGVRAFNDAGPFPNPPAGLVEKDGNIRIRWDFILKT